ncbi:MAG: Asp-tRNA(Asn)/Glu-tRNA(Gln) amidotransferase subunit GatA [Desulfovibrio sp.]|nr:Asp-tRNA(Asn)/Glu-tRNA(Gln) amidotransferase subunit GatA [Desulfovibrio sp.]
MEICDLSLSAVRQLLLERKLGCREVAQACLARIEATEPKIQALLTVDAERALQEADRLDKSGPDPGQTLWGVPLTIKDALSTKDLRTTAASRILEYFVPIYDAFAVRKLREAGAIILGKNNMDEFAMGSATENSAFQKTRNPWNTGHVPGGSSGGCAASVAAGQCFASLGSDTGGSIRQPAAFCGCVGLKPTYGRVSRFGLFAFASSMDQIGPITRTVADCATVLNAIAGHDSRDNTSSPEPVPDYLAALGQTDGNMPFAGSKIGFDAKFFGQGLSAECRAACRAALDLAQSLGAELIEVNLPDPDVATATYYVLSMAEASSNLARYDGVRYGRRAAGVANLEELYARSRSEGFGEEVKRRIMLGSFVLSSGYYDAYFRKAAQTRRLIMDQYLAALKKCDFLAMPVAPVTAWKLGSHEANPLQAYLMDAYTLPANLAGLPAISFPCGLGRDSGLPVGLQFAGRPFAEAQILTAAAIMESHLPAIGSPGPAA